MDKATVIAKLSEKFADALSLQEDEHGEITGSVNREQIMDVLRFAKEDKELQFIFLTDITAVHYPDQQKDFAVVYHVHSWVHKIRMRLKVFLEKSDLNIPSATALWNGANWMERETYDFFGVNFKGHPDLRRILNMDSMEVFPMRKEYPLEDPNRVDKEDKYFGR